MDAVTLQLILGRATGLTALKLRGALRRLGFAQPGIAAAEALLAESAASLENLGLPAAASAWLSAPERALIDADRRWHERHRIVLIDALSPGYPPQLAAIRDAPGGAFCARPGRYLERAAACHCRLHALRASQGAAPQCNSPRSCRAPG